MVGEVMGLSRSLPRFSWWGRQWWGWRWDWYGCSYWCRSLSLQSWILHCLLLWYVHIQNTEDSSTGFASGKSLPSAIWNLTWVVPLYPRGGGEVIGQWSCIYEAIITNFEFFIFNFLNFCINFKKESPGETRGDQGSPGETAGSLLSNLQLVPWRDNIGDVGL